MVGCSKLKQKLNNQTNRALEQLHREPMEQNLEIFKLYWSIVQCTMCMAHIPQSTNDAQTVDIHSCANLRNASLHILKLERIHTNLHNTLLRRQHCGLIIHEYSWVGRRQCYLLLRCNENIGSCWRTGREGVVRFHLCKGIVFKVRIMWGLCTSCVSEHCPHYLLIVCLQ